MAVKQENFGEVKELELGAHNGSAKHIFLVNAFRHLHFCLVLALCFAVLLFG